MALNFLSVGAVVVADADMGTYAIDVVVVAGGIGTYVVDAVAVGGIGTYAIGVIDAVVVVDGDGIPCAIVFDVDGTNIISGVGFGLVRLVIFVI